MGFFSDNLRLNEEKTSIPVKKGWFEENLRMDEQKKPVQVSFHEKSKMQTQPAYRKPQEIFKNPLEGFLGNKKPTEKKKTEEMIRQWDGKIVPKSEARNRYGGLIYGQELKPSGSSIRLEPSIFETAKNFTDNIRYNQKISTNNPALLTNRNVHRSVDRQTKRLNIVHGQHEQNEADVIYKALGDGFFGNMYKSLRKGTRMTGQAINTSLGSTFDWFDTGISDSAGDFFADNANVYERDIQQNKWENQSKDVKDFLNGGWKDPRWYGYGIGQLIPSIGGAVVATVATRSPTAGLTFGYTQEQGHAYNSLINAGVNPDSARVGSAIYGLFATQLEKVNFTKYMNKVLGPTNTQIAKSTLSKSFLKTLKEGGVDMIVEGGTEAMQTFAENLMNNFYGLNKDLLDGVVDSAVLGSIGGMGYATVGLGRDVVDNYAEMKNNVIKALDIVSGAKGTQDKAMLTMARSILQNYQNMTKSVGFEVHNGSESVTVETVKYDDNKYSANLRVETPTQNTTLQFGEVFDTRNKAIASSLGKSSEYLPEGTPLREAMESNIDELIGQYTEEMQRRYEEAVESGISNTVSYKSKKSDGISGAEERKHDNIIVNKRTGETLKEAIQGLKEYQDEKYIEGFKRTHIALHNTTPHYIKVYHGTNNDFERFDAKFIGNQTDDGIWGRGFYFAPTERLAKNALHGGNAKYIKEVFVNKSKLLDLKQYTNKEEFAEYLGISEDILVQTEGMYRPTMSYINTFTSAIQQLGYEGVYVDRGETSSELVIFDESNIIYKEEDIPKNLQEAEVVEYKKKSGYSTKFENNTILRELTKREQQFVENYTKLTNGEVEKIQVAEAVIDQQNTVAKVFLGKKWNDEIIDKHGAFRVENMIITLADADIILSFDKKNNRLNYIKQVGDDAYYLVALNKDAEGKYVASFYPIQNEENMSAKEYVNKKIDESVSTIKNSIASSHNGRRGTATANDRVYESIISESEENASSIVNFLGKTEETSENLEEKYSNISSHDLRTLKMSNRYRKQSAKNKQELLRKIDELNKLAMSTGVMRKIHTIQKDGALGQLDPNQNKKTKGNEEKIQNSLGITMSKQLSKTSDEYMSVLSHELGHALEWQMFGEWDTHTIKIFGEGLSEETQQEIWKELKDNTLQMEGMEVVSASPEYYYRSTELFARFIQRWFESPIILNEVAPTAMELFTRQAVHHPIIGEYLEAVQGKIDENQRKLGVEVLMDMKHRLQYSLGERAGTKAYETITRRNAMIARGKEVFGKELKKKFQGVENVELLYETIEATLETRNGKPVFGTRDFIEIPNGRYREYNQEGWSRADNQEGVEEGMVRMWNWRYTDSEGRQLWEQLNEKERQIVRDFTVPADEAVDFFNRNKIAERYGIENQVEGWIHRFWHDDGWRNSGMNGKKLGDKKAGSRKTRTHEQGYVKDMQKALYKSLVELESEEYFNNWLREFIPRITKPLADGERADAGWIEVEGDFITGFLLKGQRNEYRVTDKGTFKIQKGKYQMPLWIYEKFTDIAGILEERGMAYAIADTLANLWQVNVLTHPGTAATNGISGGLQFSLKILKNTYDAMLSGDARIVWRNFEALFGAIKEWNETPNWIWGGDDHTYNHTIGQQKYEGKIGKAHDAIGRYGNVALKAMQVFEEYWKKVIARSSGSFALSHLNQMTKDGLPPLEVSDKEAVSMIQDMVDLYGYDYENVPMWLNKLSKHPVGKLTLPFKRYMYKYFTMIAEHTFIPILDKNMPMKERIARVMGFATWLGLFMAVYAALGNDDEENRDSPNLPKYMNNRGKLKIGEDEEGNEKWVRLVKYPGFNLIGYGQALKNIAKGDIEKGIDSLGTAVNASTDGWNTMGPLATAIAGQFGLENEFDQHKTNAQKSASIAVQFVPGFRIWQDLAQMSDPYKRKTEKPYQEFTRLIPFVSEDMQEVLRGSVRYDTVPVGEKSTEKIPRKSYPEDVALSLMTGIYTSRVNPEIVERYMQRHENNRAEKEAKEQKKNEEEEILKKYQDFDGNFGQIRRRIADDLGSKTEEERRRARNIAKRWLVEVKYKDYPLVSKVSKAGSADDKILFMEELKNDMKYSEYERIARELNNAGIISEEVFREIK